MTTRAGTPCARKHRRGGVARVVQPGCADAGIGEQRPPGPMIGARVDWTADDGATDEFAFIGHGTEMAFYFQRVPEPKVAKSRSHPDFWCEDRPAEVARLVGLGATHVADHSWDDLKWSVLLDLEGHEFCVAQNNPAHP